MVLKNSSEEARFAVKDEALPSLKSFMKSKLWKIIQFSSLCDVNHRKCMTSQQCKTENAHMAISHGKYISHCDYVTNIKREMRAKETPNIPPNLLIHNVT